MSESPSPMPPSEEKGRTPPPPAASPSLIPLHEQLDRPLPPPASSQAFLQKANSGERQALTKSLGFPLRFLLRELDDSIPPQGEPDGILDSTKREASLPASPPLSPLRVLENPIHSDKLSKSPGRDGPFTATRLKSLLEDAGSPIAYMESSPEKQTENHFAAGASETVVTAKEKVMRVESEVVRRSALRRAEIGLRVSELVLCLVSFSVMAANKTSGWDGDYFVRYEEYRYCFSVNVIAFVYAAFQLYMQLHHRIWKRHIISLPLSYSFDFVMDQVLAYLLMSASSSAASVNDGWVAMFGRDKFTDMMVGSIVLSFFAFFAFSTSSIASAYRLFS